jgi:hypothetical protein
VGVFIIQGVSGLGGESRERSRVTGRHNAWVQTLAAGELNYMGESRERGSYGRHEDFKAKELVAGELTLVREST